MLKKVKSLTEINPMLGHRGVRLGISYPEIYAMQIRAVFEAAAEHIKEGGRVSPEIMTPPGVYLRRATMGPPVCNQDKQRSRRKNTKSRSPINSGPWWKWSGPACGRVGLPNWRSSYPSAQMTLPRRPFPFPERTLENKFLPLYEERGILEHNPFDVLDIKGVGRLMRITMEWARKTKPGLKVGICGEQGGQPDSIRFCHHIKMSYVSCSPPRVPIARLAAAHAKLKEKEYVLD